MTVDSAVARAGVPSAIVALADALGLAWNTHTLYVDVVAQPAFERAVQVLRAAPDYPIYFEVGTGKLIWDHTELPATREGVERFARRLFVHDLAGIQLVGPPTPEELLSVLDLLARDEAEVKAAGGLPAMVEAERIESIALVDRPLLVAVDDVGEELVGRDRRVIAALEAGEQPEVLAERLATEAGDELPSVFVNRYVELMGLVDDRDLEATEELVRIHVEAFFYLEHDLQVEVLRCLLAFTHHDQVRYLLDQFAGHELSGLADALDDESHTRLMGYARLATDTADSRPEELLPLLQSVPEVREAHRAVAERVGSLLTGSVESVALGESFASLREQSPEFAEPRDAAVSVLRHLLAVEQREMRLRRVLRIWTGKVARAVRNGDLTEAEEWLRRVLDEPPYPAASLPAVEQSLTDLATPDLINELVHQVTEGQPFAAVARLLGIWGPSVADPLIERLGNEESPAHRRVLIDCLVEIARVDSTPILAHLGDRRWFLVRNLAVVLGRCGRRDLVPALRPLLEHSDHRVRAEGMRSVRSLGGSAALRYVLAGLSDPHERVRSTALTLLRSASDPRVDRLLDEALASPRLPIDEKQRVVRLLAERGSEDARTTLLRLARRRLAVTSTARALRTAARHAIKEAS